MGSRSARSVACERDWYNYFNGSGRRRAIRRGKYRRKFKKFYKHKHSLIPDILARTGSHLSNGGSIHPKSTMSHLRDVHPDAMVFLRRWGRSFKPYRWDTPPDGEPEHKGCYENAAGLCFGDSISRPRQKKVDVSRRKEWLTYAEGIAYGPLVYPMLHGWNTLGVEGKTALDWTFYAVNHWVKYFGVALTCEEHQRVCEIQRTKLRPLCRVQQQFRTNSLFHRKRYNLRTKMELIRILQARKRAGKKLKRAAKR